MCSDHKPYVILCTEARITDNIDEVSYKIDGYSNLVCLSNSRQTGGIIVYIKNGVNFKLILNEKIDYLIWCLTFEIENCSLKGIYSVIYRSPSYGLNLTYNFLESFMEKTIQLKKFNIIVGDLNINMNVKGRDKCEILDIMNKYELDQCVNFNTRIAKNSSSCIDVVFTNKKEKIECFAMPNDRISDHETIGLQIVCDKTEISSSVNILSWKMYSKECLVKNLRKCDWSNFYSSDINIKLKILRDNLHVSVEPLVSSIVINNQIPPKKWYDNDLKKLKQSKMITRNKWLNDKTNENWANYIKVRNKYNKKIKEKKNEYTKNEIKSVGKNQKQMWKLLNKLTSNKNNSQAVNNEIIFGNEMCNDSKDMSDKFNKFFVESIIKINNDIPNENRQLLSNTNTLVNSVFKFNLVNVDEIIKVANMLTKKVNKSDLCNSIIWSDAMCYLGYFLVDIINESLYSGYFPEKWKTATVVPIQKVKNTNKAAEFRPINTLPNDEKIIENVVKTQLMNYIENNKILSDCQSAFRPQHSCETVITYLINELKKSLEDDGVIILVFLDLKRAFETLDRTRLLMALETIGICGTELEWFRSYLEGRKQRTKFNGHISHEIDVEIGVPQGTALSVILFIIYIDSITKVPKHGSVILFADDTLLIVKDRDPKTAIHKINDDMIEIEKWLNINKLKLNTEKTKWMMITKEKNRKLAQNLDDDVRIGKSILEKVDNFKYLGVVLDDKLSFNDQAMICAKKAATKVNLLYRISKMIPVNSKKLVYNSIVLPHLNYCSPVLFTCNKEQILPLQKIQNRALRIILDCNYDTPRKEMLEALNMLSVAQMIKLNVLVMIFKIIHEMMPIYLRKNLIFTNNIHEMSTRQNTTNELRLPNFKMDSTRKNVFYNGIKMYNELPITIRNSETLAKFKRECTKHIKNNFKID